MKLGTRTSYWRDRYKESIHQIQDPTLKFLFEELWNDLGQNREFVYDIPKKDKTSMVYFSTLIEDKSLSDITWTYLCNIVSNDISLGATCCKFLYKLLDNNLYNGEYSDDLYERKNLFLLSNNYQKNTFLNLFIYANIHYLYYDVRKSVRKYTVIQADGFLRQILIEFYTQNKTSMKVNPRDFYALFSDSLGPYVNTITGISSFSYATYSTQTDYFISHAEAKWILQLLNLFYIYLTEHPTGEGKAIFKTMDNIEVNILKRDDFAQRTIDGFKIHYYNPMAPIPFDDKWVLHINGFEKASTKTYTDTTKVYDFTKIVSEFYRKLAKRYVWLELGNNFNSKYEQYNMLIDSLNYIYELKQSKDFPNPSLSNMSIHEATILRNHIGNYELSTYSKNSKLSAIRRFLKTQETNHTMTFDILIFNYLNEFKKTNSNNAEAIPDEDLIRINAIMKKYADESYVNALYYAIFHLCLQTEFRISQICHLKANCINSTMKNNQYMITTVSKTSNGQEYTAVISDLTKAHLDYILKQTEVVREECTDNNVKDYLFLHKSQQKRYLPINSAKFRQFFSKCCEEAGTKIYSTNNLRDTHMTKAEEYRMRHGKSNAILSVLSGHKRVDTTNNHYIETELVKMLESTYGIIFGDVNTYGEVVSTVDKSIGNKEHEVEQGCGYCKKDTCGIYNSTPCLMCNHFITTVKHEKQFSDSMKQIDDMIKNAPTPHDKDDLVNIKRLYGAYLLEIWKKKGEVTNE
ncbi:site-specific integrase [Bacillaceae bacterium CLA-AA-H227]|uniref:Site-specific integrase n=1 Tax=Robertmurraya yapensis (ex Hitch et al 2024) TaxID=3133160 RepID=A0ACC6SFN7_9BACI